MCSKCEDPDMVHESKTQSKIVTARKARKATRFPRRPEIRTGDKVKVDSWFEYELGGKRLGYRHTYTRVAKGPAWVPNPTTLEVTVTKEGTAIHTLMVPVQDPTDADEVFTNIRKAADKIRLNVALHPWGLGARENGCCQMAAN